MMVSSARNHPDKVLTSTAGARKPEVIHQTTQQVGDVKITFTIGRIKPMEAR